MPSLLASLSSPASGRHRVELERFGSRITVTAYSPIVIGHAVNAKEYFSERTGEQSLDVGASGVASDRLLEWVRAWDKKASSCASGA